MGIVERDDRRRADGIHMADQATLLMQDFGRSKPRFDILEAMHHAAREKQKPYQAQIGEILRLGLGDGTRFSVRCRIKPIRRHRSSIVAVRPITRPPPRR